MDYVESLLEEYFEISQTIKWENDTKSAPSELMETLLSIEEEICWEFNVPPTNKYRDLFRWIPDSTTKQNYVQTSMQNLSREKARYFYKPNQSFLEGFKAA
ncbi:hypothetical protein AB3N58_11655 [Leptospira sp. WS60.C2]